LESVALSPTKAKHSRKALGIFLLAASFYLYDYCVQVSPSIMTQRLMLTYHFDAAGLGEMTAFFFYSYAPMQLFGGLLFDRFGARRVLSIAIMLCAFAVGIFATTTDIHVAQVAWFLIGAGAATSFVGGLVLIAHWFPVRHFAMMAGVLQLMGSLGAIFGQAPLDFAMQRFGWHTTLLGLAVIGGILSIAVALIVRDYPKDQHSSQGGGHIESDWQKLKIILGKRQTWLVALYAFAIWGPIVIFAGLWGVPYLTIRLGGDSHLAAWITSCVWLGVGIGSPLLGLLSDVTKHRIFWLRLLAFIGVIVTLYLLFGSMNSISGLFILAFCFGLAGSGQSLSFALVKDNNKHHHVGTASGFNNMMLLMSGALCQPLTGLLLKSHWQGTIINNVPVYSLADYRYALMIVPIGFIGAFLLTFLLKESHCKSIEGELR